MKRHMQQTLALGGIAQAAFLTHQLGRYGTVAPHNLHTCLHSLFVINPRRTEEVYGSPGRLNLGLQVLQELLQGRQGLLRHPDVIRYLFSLLHLEGRLSRQPQLLRTIGRELEAILGEYPEDNRSEDPVVIARLGKLYQDSLGTLGFRIQVKGSPEFLRHDANAARIRAVLLAGIRSAVLWRQLGGRRWHLLWHRRRIARDVLLLLGNMQDFA